MCIVLEMYVEFVDGVWLGFFLLFYEIVKIGVDNFDNLYQYVCVDGCCEYCVMGWCGMVVYLSFGMQKGGYEIDGKMLQIGFFDVKQFEIVLDGSVEIVLSVMLCVGNWVWMELDINVLLVCQIFFDWCMEMFV